jgi:hypothetical protein
MLFGAICPRELVGYLESFQEMGRLLTVRFILVGIFVSILSRDPVIGSWKRQQNN